MRAVMTSPTVSQIGSEHRAHSNKRCMVFSTSPRYRPTLFSNNPMSCHGIAQS
jgi:hypothetical protein